MAKKQTPESAEISDFDLKHRITGAAVLLFLGALVLPWLLGPPSEASKVSTADGTGNSSLISAADIEPIALGNGQPSSASEIAETVYISKITPLDAQSDKQLVAAANKAADKEVAAESKAKSAGSEPKSAGSKPGDNVKPKAVASADKSRSKEAEQKKAAEAKKVAEDKKKAELAKAKKDKEKREKEQREKELQAAVAAESGGTTTSAVDVGWVVQVGLFTEKSRALALISELKNKGFTASNSIVDTNRGPKTGTRVWLGPFAKRSAAQNEQKRLKSKAGKDGFIRVYP